MILYSKDDDDDDDWILSTCMKLLGNKYKENAISTVYLLGVHTDVYI